LAKISIYILDDHRIFSDGLKRTLESRDNYSVNKIFDCADDLTEALNYTQPDLLITDISMPGLNGIELASKVHKLHSHVKILILSMHMGAAYVRPAMESGAHGYLLKDSRADDIFEAIRIIMAGGTYISPKIASLLLASNKNEPEITPRELEVLREIATGIKTSEMADKLFISINTVETHRRNLLLKSGCKNMAELIGWGFRQGLIQE